MKISTKGRYALAATISMAQFYNSSESITLISISERLGISKIYLEQVFSLLKRGGVVNSVKGSQGGYQLALPPHQLTVRDVLFATEASLFENTEDTVSKTIPEIEQAMQHRVFHSLDKAIKDTLQNVTLSDLVSTADSYKTDQGFMFYI
ncbi:MAG: transcriptional regulator [Herbinix sp.]|jgi:Rrf2 family protein|nr:transcriptional regulator [Herbinix sp.]